MIADSNTLIKDVSESISQNQQVVLSVKSAVMQSFQSDGESSDNEPEDKLWNKS